MYRDEVFQVLGQAYADGVAARLENAQRMGAILGGTQAEDGRLARAQITAAAAVRDAAVSFQGWVWRTPDDERQAMAKLETAMRAVGEWEGVSALVDSRSEWLDTAASHYGELADAPSELTAALPPLAVIRQEVRMGFDARELEAARETALRYSAHQLEAFAASAEKAQAAAVEASPREVLAAAFPAPASAALQAAPAPPAPAPRLARLPEAGRDLGRH